MSPRSNLSALWRLYRSKMRGRLRPRTPGVHVLRDVQSPQLDNRRDLYVYLPPSYAEGRRRYPVVYLQDGQNLFEDRLSFTGAWHVQDAAQAAAARGLEAILVGIPNMGEQRIAEYSPFDDSRHGPGRGEAYATFVVRTVKPLVDHRFRTLPEREHTSIGGSSMGGLISLYAYARFPEVFGSVMPMSPAFWFADGGIFRYVERATLPKGRVWLDCGLKEHPKIVDSARQMRDLLLAKGYRPGAELAWEEDPDGIHNEVSWGKRFHRALPFLLTGEIELAG